MGVNWIRLFELLKYKVDEPPKKRQNEFMLILEKILRANYEKI